MPVIATAGALNTNAVNLNALLPPKYIVSKSLRFRASASATLQRTPGANGSATQITYSFWFKPSLATTIFGIAAAFNGFTNGSRRDWIGWNGNQFVFTSTTMQTGSFISINTNPLRRDPAAWYHVLIIVDTTQAGGTNGFKVYVNGVLESTTVNAWTQNRTLLINQSGVTQYIGYYFDSGGSGSTYGDGCIAEFYCLDGIINKVPTDFITYDSLGNIQPKAYTGTYGTAGFYLPFTNTASIGTDSSGNGNNWTNNNLNTATANTTYDSMIDSPTSYNDGTVYGRGNYPTLNPLDNSGGITISDGNLRASWASASDRSILSTHAIPPSGKFYAELTNGTLTTSLIAIAFGLGTATSSRTGMIAANMWVYYASNQSYISRNGTLSSQIGSNQTIPANGILQVAIDRDNNQAWLGYNNVWVDATNGITGNPTAGTNPTVSNLPADLFFLCGLFANSGNVNFGQRPFTYTPPTGFRALNTQNLPNPPIPNPEAHFKTTLWTGTGSNQAISNRNANTQVAFSPALVWNKSRGAGLSNILTDIIRGFPTPTRSQIFTDQTVAAEARTDRLQSFDTEGFTVGTYTDVNLSGNTFVGWQWNANKSNTFNTFGSSSSNTIVNTAAGFSMVVYAGTGSNATVGHGLPKAPNLIISRPINDSSRNWPVYHSSLGSNTTYINTTAAQVIDATVWTAAPNNTVFSIGSNIDINRNINVNIAYCWTAIPGYSAFGSYVGNGNADGPFVYTGFRPRWIMFKNATTGTGASWWIYDTVRNTFNVIQNTLYTNTTGIENNSSIYNLDIISNGFKIRNTDDINLSGATVIYAAFAEMPFKYARAR